MRKLATIRQIDALTPIEGADTIECAHVDGWKVVVKKGEYVAGDLAVYIEIDSWVPHKVAPFLSRGNFPHVFNEVKGERLRTVKLRGQLSQGLLLNLDQVMPETHSFGPDADVSEYLGIQKWEPPLEFVSSDVKGAFPSQIPKTDQERIQNLSKELDQWKTENLTWEVTEKLEGSSMTAYLIDREFGVCSRNQDLKCNPDATFWRTAIDAGLEAALRASGDNIALQGELIGEGIQGNIYNMKGTHFYVYDIYDIANGRYWSAYKCRLFCEIHHLNHCPVFQTRFFLDDITIDELLTRAEGNSVLIEREREGLVYKCNDRQASFKTISNRYLLKSKD